MKNLETVQQIYAAFGRGDVPAILETVSDDVAWESWRDNYAQRAGVPYLLPRRGKAGVAEFFGSLAALDIKSFQVLRLLDGGAEVAASIDIEFLVKATGKMLHDEELHLWTFDDRGKVIRFRHYVDTAKHIEATLK